MQRKIGIYCRTACTSNGMEAIPQIVAQRTGLLKEIAKMNSAPGSWGEVIRIYEDDGISGLEENRQGLSLLRQDIQKGIIDTVVVKDAARLSRNISVTLDLMEEFSKNNVAVISFPENQDGGATRLDLTGHQFSSLSFSKAMNGGNNI